MKIFFDTEFTGLTKDTTLISIGCVSENLKKFYAEFTDYNKSQCSDWIKVNVLNNLILTKNKRDNYQGCNAVTVLGNTKKVVDAFKEWLDQFEAIQFVSDVSHYDFVLLADLFGGALELPSNISPVCHDISQDIAKHLNISDAKAFNVNREEFAGFFDTLKHLKHNALFDAEVIKQCYTKMENLPRF